jgi:peptidyl-prolyl cis-trans isomerase B (cyclophilin B)
MLVNKKDYEKLAKTVKSDKEYRATIQKIKEQEKKQAAKNLINTIKITGIVAGAVILTVLGFAIANNVTFTSAAAKTDTVKAIIKTSKGDITLELDKTAAPRTVANFVQNVKDGIYTKSFFNRIIKDGILQGGVPQDPVSINGQPPAHRPGIKDTQDYEVTGLKHDRWTIAMASTDGKANKSIFYINLSNQQKLEGKGVVFGKVVDGYQVIADLTNVKLTTQVLSNEIAIDSKTKTQATSQSHNGTLYEVSNNEVSRAQKEDDVRINEVLIVE